MQKIEMMLMFLLLGAVNISCQETEKLPEKLSNSLLYIEAKDEVGTGTGRYTEIVSYDLKSNKEHYLTNDIFYDRYPSYSSIYNSIVFESKRSNPGIAGLSASSAIYMLKLEDGSINKLDLYKGPAGVGLKEQHLPSFNKGGNIVSFMKYNDNTTRDYSLILYYLEKDSLEFLKNDVEHGKKFIWSPDDEKIFYDYYHSKTLRFPVPEQSINSVDVLDKITRKIIIADTNYNELGDVGNDKLLYVFYKSRFERHPVLRILDLESLTDVYTLNMYELGFKQIKRPVFANDETVYFIGNPIEFEGALGDDIYKLNLKTDEITRITNTELMKEDLVYIK